MDTMVFGFQNIFRKVSIKSNTIPIITINTSVTSSIVFQNKCKLSHQLTGCAPNTVGHELQISSQKSHHQHRPENNVFPIALEFPHGEKV